MEIKNIIVWLAIALLSSFCLTTMTGSGLVNTAVPPEVPREGEPIICTFKLNNHTSEASTIDSSMVKGVRRAGA